MPSSDIIWFGNMQAASLMEDVPATIEFDVTGVARATLTYQCKWQYVERLIKRLRYHPDFYWLKLKHASATREEALHARITATFEGIDPEQQDTSGTTGGGGGGITGEITTYTLETAVDSEPIETHPDFITFAGKWNDENTWINGADFDKTDGRFKGFRPMLDNGTANPKGRVTSYLSPGVIYTRTRLVPGVNVQTLGIRLNAVGNRDTPPSSGILPAIASGRNWLYLGATVEQIGDGIRVVERWRLSGRNGWDEDIYT
jgi:hypothetical protein